ncbi:GDP-L-fucose synthase family protein [Microvirga pakistanensis]|uniref:GDP-L-fucose synthase family protein n=1 Tax=Microvirga pakistanensis TaxID=1682650 RepID=UPI001FCF09C2|nr:GDP-L-fucose synthase [Microvirga pakistanensis]
MTSMDSPRAASPSFALAGKRVWVAGHRGMVGSALVRRLAQESCEIVTVDRSEVDLTRQIQVERWMERNRPDVVLVAAARVGGIMANATYPGEFLYENMMIGANVIHSARECGVEKLLFLGSSCIYPKHAPQPIPEHALLSGPLEPTNEGYAIAKIAAIKLAEYYNRHHARRFISAMPTNLYGPNDNFDPVNSHVLPALIRRIHEARHNRSRVVEIWGSGSPLREFLHVDDLADACIFLVKTYDDAALVNVGSNQEISIRDVAEIIADVVGFEGNFIFDTTKPDGAPRKLVDSSRIQALGWRPRIPLRQGIEELYRFWRQAEGCDDSTPKAVAET